MQKEQFRKKFSLGLLMDTTLDEFEVFLDKYHEYIDNFYFSLPLGDHMHSRQKVVDQFHNPQLLSQFWKQLDMIRSHNIKLELLFNARACTTEDVLTGRRMMDAHGFTPDKIGIVDSVYDTVREVYPDLDLVYSFNNYPSSASSYDAHGHEYSEYVIGRQHIRDLSVFEHIHGTLHGRTILLVNNGCSHICGGCSTHEHCYSSHEIALHKHSAEYLYALQSVMPFELEEDYIGLSNIDLIKISSRNTNIEYLEKCLKSYLYGNEDQWIQEDIQNYSLWAHLTWHMPYYPSFDLGRIIDIKRNIYSGKEIDQDKPDVAPVNVISDLTDRLLFSDPETASRLLEKNLEYMRHRCTQLSASLAGVMLGVYQCRFLLSEIHWDTFESICCMIRNHGLKVWFMMPEKADITRTVSDHMCEEFIDGVFANDAETYKRLSELIQLPVYAGRNLDSRLTEQNDSVMRICSLNDQNRVDPCGAEQMVLQYPMVPFCQGICPDYAIAEAVDVCGRLSCLEYDCVSAPCHFHNCRSIKNRGNAIWLNFRIDSRILTFISRKRPVWLYDAESDR